MAKKAAVKKEKKLEHDWRCKPHKPIYIRTYEPNEDGYGPGKRSWKPLDKMYWCAKNKVVVDYKYYEGD